MYLKVYIKTLVTGSSNMVRLAENTGYGLDNIESNWKEYNGSTVEFSIDFDATIVKFHTVTDRESKENYGAITERLRNAYGMITG